MYLINVHNLYTLMYMNDNVLVGLNERSKKTFQYSESSSF